MTKGTAMTIRKRSGWAAVLALACAVLLACGSQVTPKSFLSAQCKVQGVCGNNNAGGGGQVIVPIGGSTQTGGGSSQPTNIGGATFTKGGSNGQSGSVGTGANASGGGKVGGTQGIGLGGITAGSCAGFKNTTGINSSTITLSNVADVSGPVAGLFAGAQQAMKAFVAYFNSQCGICGRKLAVNLLDSQTSETGDQQATTTACGNSFAMVGSMGAFDGGGTSEVTHCGIPDLRAAVTESSRLNSPDVFAAQSLNAAYEPEAPADYYKSAFGNDVITHAAFVYLNAGAASFNGQQEIKAWTARGFKFVYTSGIPVTEINYTSYVSQMQSKGVKYVQYVGAYQEAVLLAKAMASQGFKAQLVFDPEVYDPGFVQSGGSAVNGAHVWINSAVFEEAGSNPEMQLYERWLNITSPGKSPNYFGLFAWAAGELFATEAIKLGAKLTRASMITALKGVDNFTGNGLFGPQHVGPRMTGGCYGFITLQSGKWVREGPKPYSCKGLVHVGT